MLIVRVQVLNQQDNGLVKTNKEPVQQMEKKTRSIITAISLKTSKLIDFVSNNLSLTEYWLKRVSAVVVDYFVILFATGILWPTSHFLEFVLVSGVLSLVYFSVMEARFGYTLGKKVFSLKVITSKEHNPTVKTSLIRNISKFNIILLIIDLVVGFNSKHHQKFVDRLAKTKVVEDSPSLQKPISEVLYYEQTPKIS